ncbi:lipase member M-like [Grus japonensis]|uniref:Lipase member M-like n=1 Tax=Grus japonensis TaxID=30415 RepID=A0ABC9X542_GRUJA
MWQLLVALCLAQGLGDVVLCTGASHDNPEQFMNISQIICFHGYYSKEHQVLTEDGYFLTMNRIPGGREEAGSRGPKLPVLLQHGLVLDGSNWVSNFPSTSLGFILADAGYDVWIGNSRGNSWSRRHLNLSVDQEEFWDFSFHEMAVYDLPAMVGFILRQTGQEKLFYIGHAQGNSLGFIAFSSMPQLAEKIKMFFVLGPAYALHTGKGPVLSLFYLPDAIIKTAKTEEFKQFDYGEENKEKYNQTSPPFYRTEDMMVPTALWSGGEDWVTSTEETQCLLPRITKLVCHEHFPDWNHWDHIWGLDAPQCMYRQIVALMEQNP